MKSAISFLCIAFTFFIHHNALGQSYFKNEFAHVWQRSTAYTLEVAEAMPAEKWDFRPSAESMSFQEQLTHLVYNLSFLSEKITGKRQDFLLGKDPNILSKQELSKVLGEAFGYIGHLIAGADDKTLQEPIEFGGEKMTKENLFYLMRDHATHHRAQAILYLRMNGKTAPKYRGW